LFRSPPERPRTLVVVSQKLSAEFTSVSFCKNHLTPSLCSADHSYRFYITGVTVVGLLVPSNSEGLNLSDGTAAASPFVIAIKKAGIKGLPSLINACLLTSGVCKSSLG
jgi:hypothetical protein